MQARTRKKRLEYLNKALEAEPENVDAQLMQIQCTYDSKPDEQLPELYDLMKKAEKQLEREGFFKNDAGDFWLVLETRPYMRVCFSRFEALADELSAFGFLFASSPYFFKWALSYLRSETAAKRKK